MQKQQSQQNIKRKSNQIYVHSFPFRAVLPYSHRYETFAKSRWYGKPLLETLVKQFKAYNQAYYRKAVQQNRITINSKHVTIDYVIKNGDKLTHQAIRQQPPILDLQIDIIEDNQDYLVVNKPPSFTVHTGGGFHYNTLLSVLDIQKGYKNLFVLHRLDRLTSGLIIFGKTKQKPQIFHKQNQSTQIKKMYYARVSGNFQWQQKTLCAEIQCVSHKDGVYKVTRELQDKQLEFLKNIKLQLENGQNKQQNQQKAENNPPFQQPSMKKRKKNKQQHNPDIKESVTHFRRVFYDESSDSSLIQCYPISGRTHQIRVHLQFLGYPILNDVVYGGRFVGNNVIDIMARELENKQNNCKKSYQQKQINDEFGKKKVKIDESQQVYNELLTIQKPQKIVQDKQQSQKQIENSQRMKKLKQNLQKQWDIDTKPWQICLHSYQYILQGKTYRTKKPYWADKQFKFKK